MEIIQCEAVIKAVELGSLSAAAEPPQFISLGIAYPSETELSPAAKRFIAFAISKLRNV